MKKQLYRAAAATVLGLSLTTGIVAADTGNITNTGPGSDNKVTTKVTDNSSLKNRNDIDLSNHNSQHAYTGDAKVKYNTTGGDATSGAAMNDNSVSADVTVDNSASSAGGSGFLASAAANGGGTIDTTGPGSNNQIKTTVTDNSSVSNHNDIDVHNSNHQTASSGDASVTGNTTGGSATSGDATNTNSATFTFSVTN